MVIPTQVEPFLQWLLLDSGDGRSALYYFAMTTLALLAIALACSYLVVAFRHGPVRGAKLIVRAISAGIMDLVRISPRRVFGLATLAFREALRRHIWVGLIVFLVLIAFTGWFLDPTTDQPAKLYISWVVTPTTWLMLALSLYLSSLSLPSDIKNRTIYTVVTKPVRASEIILGRIAGFTAACTLMLAIMGGVGYFFIIRALSHTHQIVVEETDPNLPPQSPTMYGGETTEASGHKHLVKIPANSFSPGVELDNVGDSGALAVMSVTGAARQAGVQEGDLVTAIDGDPVAGQSAAAAEARVNGPPGSSVKLTLSRNGAAHEVTLQRLSTRGETDVVQGHRHEVIARFKNGKVQYEMGPAEGMLAARIPIYGTLKFRDRQGNFRRKGISVGKLFGYRSYIQGNTLAAAIWTFDGLTEKDFPDGVPLDLDIRVYRLQKGKVDQGITGSIWLRNPQTGLRSKARPFTAKEFTLDRQFISRKQVAGEDPRSQAAAAEQGRPLKKGAIDLFDDLTSKDGKIELWLQCAEPGQSFGMARADVYVRGHDASFTWNYVKAIFEIWLQVVLVTSLAVMFSSFLSGPVAILVTVTAILMGFSSSFIHNLTNSVIYREELKVIETVRQFATQNQIDLEREGIWHLAEQLKQSGQLGPDAPDLQALQVAATPEGEQKRQALFSAVRQTATANRIDLEAEGVARMAQTMARQANYESYDAQRLDKALRLKVDQVDVLDRVWGGGPVEAFYRLITQMNLTSELDPEQKKGQPPNRMTRAIQTTDDGLMRLLQALAHVLPDFRRFSDTDYLANGYNINGSLVGQHAAATFGFSLAAFVAGYFCLKYREVAR